MELLPLAHECVKKSLAGGVKLAEAFIISYRTKSVYIEEDKPKVGEERQEVGLGLKVAIGKKVAHSAINLEGAKDVRTVTSAAIRAVKNVPEDPQFQGIPSEQAKGSVEKTYDAKTAEYPVEDMVELAVDLTSASKVKKYVTVPKGIFRVQDYEIRIVNSNGVEGSHHGTLTYLYFTAKSRTKSKTGEGIVKSLGTSLDSQDFENIGKKLGERAVSNLTANPLREKISGTFILDPVDLGEMLIQSVGSAVNGEDVQKKRSPWQDMKGKQVASENITLSDMARLPAGLSSCIVDDEGHPTLNRPLIVDGVLRDFVQDYYNAVLLGGRGGNALRRTVTTVEGAYARPAQCSVTNLVIEPGLQSLDELIASVKKGAYIEKFAAPEVNPYNGAFALEVRNASIIENGSLGKHVKYALLVGNIFEGLRNVVGVGKDLSPSHGFLMTPGCCYLPPIAFEGFELVGQT